MRFPGKPILYFLLFIVVAGFCTGFFLRDSIPFQSLDLSIDMEVDKGGCVEVRINGKVSPVYRLSLIPGRRHVYRFSDMPEIIKHIRIDPVDSPEADIKIYGLVLSRGEETLQQWAGADLQKWSLLNARSMGTNESFCHLESTTNDPLIAQETNYVFSNRLGRGLKLFANYLVNKRPWQRNYFFSLI